MLTLGTTPLTGRSLDALRVAYVNVLKAGGYRFYFFSREEERPHVHVQHADGDAKFWLEPKLALAQNHGLSARQVAAALRLLENNKDEIRAAWKTHFGR